jgi:hypothetical protein
MPSLAQFGTTVPPLPSHYRSHAIYTFCKGLHTLMKQLQPTPLPGQGERWALVQKIPSSGALNGSSSTEWFTSVADARAVEGLSKEKKVENSLLESMAAGGDKFGKYHRATSRLLTLRFGPRCQCADDDRRFWKWQTRAKAVRSGDPESEPEDGPVEGATRSAQGKFRKCSKGCTSSAGLYNILDTVLRPDL